MNPITKEFNKFFIELAANNHKDWFDENRKRYENYIKKPFEEFVGLLIDELQKLDKNLNPKPKDCIFRINRDIRFSKDKTPYKMNRSAAINKGGRKDMSPSGIYVHLGPEHIRVYRGLFMIKTPEINKVRAYMKENMSLLKKCYSDKKFKQCFNEVRGEESKRVPKEFKEAAEKEPLILKKQWYYFKEMSPDLVTDPALISKIMDCYKAGNPMSNYLTKALA